MRDKGLDKGLIREFDDSKRDKLGWNKGFFGFRKMFRDYLTKLNVAFFDTCCPAATTTGIVPVRFNDTSNVLQYFDVTTETWLPVDAGALVSDSITLDDGTVSALAVRIGADANNGLYGVSDTVLGIAVEGAQVATFTTTGLTVDSILEKTTNAGVTIEAVKLEDGGVTNAGETMFAMFTPVAAAQSLSGAGAVNVTSYYTAFTSSGASQALSLANGTQIGQVKVIAHVVDGGSGVLTPTSLSGGTTITFTTVGETAELIWNGIAWVVLRLYNTATPGTPPVLA